MLGKMKKILEPDVSDDIKNVNSDSFFVIPERAFLRVSCTDQLSVKVVFK